MKDPVEAQPPSGDGLLVILRMEKPRDRVPSAPFDDFPFYLRHGTATKSIIMSEPSEPCIIGLTHVVN